MNQLNKFDLTVKSAIVRSDKPYNGLDAEVAPNPNQMNRVTGFLNDGAKVVIAQRHGKGGMDFNKLLGGKVFAVAADGLSPVFEKDGEGKPTQKQKVENGLPLYSSSGFYLLSSKEYPAIKLMEAYTLLRNNGEQVWIITEDQLSARQKHVISDASSMINLIGALESAIDDNHNLVKGFDEEINKKRRRGVERAKGDAEDRNEKYAGIEHSELSVSKKDGNALIMYCWQVDGGQLKTGVLLREAEIPDENRDDGLMITQIYTAKESVGFFTKSAAAKEISQAVRDGKKVEIGFVQGHLMRTSVSFRRKAANALAEATKIQYGDAIYIHAALKGWTRGIISLMYSQHPNFPTADYDVNHYVAACRQAEIGMNKKEDGKWSVPVGIHYTMAARLMA